MKILLLDVNCKNSSTGKIVYDLYKEINNTKGNEAAICYGRGEIIKEKNIYKFASEIEVNIHAFLSRVTGLMGYFSPFATRKLIKFIEEYKPDVIHIHELHSYFVNIYKVLKYIKSKNIKVVWTFHCEFMYTGKCGHSFECNKWQTECRACPKINEYPKSLFFDFSNKMFNDKKNIFKNFNNLVIVTPSKWLADRVKKSFLKNFDIRIIHNGIDNKNTFYFRELESIKRKHQLTNEKIILSIAPNLMSELKGGRWVLEVAKRYKDKNVKFIMIGIDDLTEKFEENIIPLGRIYNQEELAKYYSMADLFLICSKKENFPTTCLEAISCGTPIVGFDEGGTKETAPDNYGTFIEYGNMELLKQGIDRFLEVKNKEKDKIEKKAKELYSKDKMFNEYMKLYRFK